MIELKNLTKSYGKQAIFNNSNFNFPDSGLVCLLGASGCGKSTLLNMIAGFDSDYSGDITVCGTSISKMNAADLCSYRRDNVGFIFQNYNLLPGYTVRENVLLSGELNQSSDGANKKKAKSLLRRLNMSDKEMQKIENLSGGQKQRVAIARALINDPSIILADEPTGALDRKNATEIMELLKEISQDRLVLVITHDQRICEFADQTVSIQDGEIVGEEMESYFPGVNLKEKVTVQSSSCARGFKNFKVHLTRYIAVSLAISIGILAFMLSLSSGNLMEQSIAEFKEKNTAFNNGYVKIEQDTEQKVEKTLALLRKDERVENVYEQYCLKDSTLTLGKKSETMAEKYPMPKATENMSYGSMPKTGKNEIALSPSLAKKLEKDIIQLIGKELTLRYGGADYKLTISGIYNAGYDDFFISSDLEQKFYEQLDGEKPYSFSYDVKAFADVVPVSKLVADQGVKSENVAKEVETLQRTFENLSRLFFIVSILILAIGLFISAILLIKLRNSRYKEIGLLAALGFSKNQISTMIISENILLSAMAALLNALLIGITSGISAIFSFNLSITAGQIALSVLGTAVVVILVSLLASYKLIHTEPAVALRK